MASTVGHQTYDENLLASAPAATKAQLQSGYNPDLLVEKHTPPPSRPSLTTPAPVRDGRDLESQSIPPKQPFYRTKKGIIIIVVAIIVIIAVVVGGAVGGSKKKNNNLTTSNGQGTPSSSANNTSSAAGDSQVVGAPGPTPSSASGVASTTISNAVTLPHFSLPIATPSAAPQGPGTNQEAGLFSGFS